MLLFKYVVGRERDVGGFVIEDQTVGTKCDLYTMYDNVLVLLHYKMATIAERKTTPSPQGSVINLNDL